MNAYVGVREDLEAATGIALAGVLLGAAARPATMRATTWWSTPTGRARRLPTSSKVFRTGLYSVPSI